MRGSISILVILALALVACGSAMPTVLPTASPIAPALFQASAPEQASPSPSPMARPNSETMSTAASTPNPTSLSPDTTIASPGVTQTAESALTAVTPPGGNEVTPNPGFSAGIVTKTYVNETWHVALDYPADWSVQEKGSLVIFVSPTGSTIQLAPAAAGSPVSPGLEPNEDLPNTRCSTRTNPHSISERVCFDTISLSTSAVFDVQTALGATRLELSTGRRTGDVPVLNAMLATVRAAG